MGAVRRARWQTEMAEEKATPEEARLARLRAFKRDLTARLYLCWRSRRCEPEALGATTACEAVFPRAVLWARHTLGVGEEVAVGLPTPEAIRRHRSDRLARYVKRGQPGHDEWLRAAEWTAALDELLARALPPEYRELADQPALRPGWDDFLTACILFDPPTTDLFAFAAIGNASETPLEGLVASAPQHLPIVHLDDPYRVWQVERARTERILLAILRGMEETHGLDVGALIAEKVREVDDAHAPVDRQRRAYIVVDSWTREEEVRAAFRALTVGKPDRPTPGRPPRDLLMCLQCAIWQDECGWSVPEIARHLGWRLTLDGYEKTARLSSRVEEHVAQGRRLLDTPLPE